MLDEEDIKKTEEEQTEETPSIPKEEDTGEEICDPSTMNCDELGEHFRGLVKKDRDVESTIKKIEEIKEYFPSDEMDKVYDVALKERDSLDKEIDTVVERTISCKVELEEEEKDE